MYEQSPNGEREPIPPYEVLLESVREKGIDDPETLELFRAWTQSEAVRIEQITDEIENTHARLDFEWNTAKIYARGGDTEEAISTLREGAYYARKQGMGNTCAEFEDKILNLGGDPIGWNTVDGELG
jgi:hypothetical protein